ncbi:MAG: Smr/MutS family protein [Treponema sp.]|jgi:DNA-nicking Smr family endonuclease|nr:Smr/MutS family protein [Treponema sp.]
MNFEDILNEWDRRTDGVLVSQNSALEKSRSEAPRPDRALLETRALERRRLLQKKPDDVIDLHGLSQDEAWEALDDFFKKGKFLGHEKVLIIHGKGNHSEIDGVLKVLTGKFIERCPIAGQSGHSTSMGGSGATWVLLK